MRLKKIKIIGKLFFDVFTNGSREDIEITEEDYKKLERSERTPSKSSKKWSFSYADNKYDTSSGRFEEDCYYELTDNFVVRSGGYEFDVPKDKIVNNEIDDNYLSDIKSKAR